MTAPISFEIKSQLAKLLATENITMRHSPSAKTAFFDIKNRLLVLPMWQNISEDLYDMLVVHEVGHALDTPEDAWMDGIRNIAKKHHGDAATDKQKAIIKDYINVVEDARIDKRQKRRYPGSNRNYIVGYKELHSRNFFGIANKDVHSMRLIDRLNIHFKNGAGLNIAFSSKEKEFVARISTAETFDEVLAISDDLYAFAIEQKNNPVNDKSEEDFISEFSDDESDDDSDSDEEFEFDDDNSDEGSDDDSDSESDDESNDGNSNSDSDDESDDDSDSDTSSSGSDGETDSELESETQEAANKAMESILVNNDKVEYHYVDIPTFNHSHIVDDYKKVMADWKKEYESNNKYYNYDKVRSVCSSELKAFLVSEKAAISFMVKEFEQRKAADTYTRTTIAKTGVLDTNKIHSYKYNEDLFKKMNIVPEGKNHGFVMLLDWSGSMLGNLKHTVKHLISMVMFCKRTQIPFEVYTFRSLCGYDGTPSHKQIEGVLAGTNRITMNGFKIRNVLSSRMNIATLNDAMTQLWMFAHGTWFHSDPLNSTPLNQSILAFDKVVNDFRKKHKVQVMNTIIITDGASDNWGYRCNTDYRKQNIFILQDKVSKKTYYVDGSGYGNQTQIALNVLRDRTGSNVIGFFLNNQSLNRLHYIKEFSDAEKKHYSSNGYVSIDNAGYDEYYIMDIKKLNSSNENLVVDSKMTKKAILKGFMKFSNKKSINRVMLTKFIDKISKTFHKAA